MRAGAWSWALLYLVVAVAEALAMRLAFDGIVAGGGARIVVAVVLLHGVVQPLGVWLLVRRQTDDSAAAELAAWAALTMPGTAWIVPWLRPAAPGPAEELEMHPARRAATELPFDAAAFEAEGQSLTAVCEGVGGTLDDEPLLRESLRLGSVRRRLNAVHRAAALGTPVGWRAVLAASGDVDPEVADRARALVERRRAEGERALRAAETGGDGAIDGVLRRLWAQRAFAVSGLWSDAERSRRLEAALGSLRDSLDRSRATVPLCALGARLALDLGRAEEAAAWIESLGMSDRSTPAITRVAREVAVARRDWGGVRSASRALGRPADVGEDGRDGGHVPVEVLGLEPLDDPGGGHPG